MEERHLGDTYTDQQDHRLLYETHHAKWDHSVESSQEQLSLLEQNEASPDKIARQRYLLDLHRRIRDCLRIPNDDDVKYRETIISDCERFAMKNRRLKGAVFHGTPFYNIESIFKDGTLKSRGNMGGGGGEGYISISNNPDDLGLILSRYMGISKEESWDYCMPGGCLFIIKPEAEDFVDISKDSLRPAIGKCIKDFDFREEPNKLLAILTTSENVPVLKGFALQYGIDPDKIAELLEYIKRPNAAQALGRKITRFLTGRR